MRRFLIGAAFLVVLACLCQAGTVNITNPTVGDESYLVSSNVTITWNYSGIPDGSLVKLVLFKGGTVGANKVGNIVQNISIGAGGLGSYAWHAGQYDGGYSCSNKAAAAGPLYYIRIISMNGDFSDFSDHPFQISCLQIRPDRFRFFEFDPIPECPVCGMFDPRDLLGRINPDDILFGKEFRIVLRRGNRQVGDLGKVGPNGLALGGAVRIQFLRDDFALIGKGGGGFELAYIGENGRILGTETIVLRQKQAVK